MSFLGTLTLSLGAAIAKALLKSWIGDGAHTAGLGAAIDTVKGQIEKILGKVPEQRRIEQVGAQVAERTCPEFPNRSSIHRDMPTCGVLWIRFGPTTRQSLYLQTAQVAAGHEFPKLQG
jgi:hypothetical protein